MSSFILAGIILGLLIVVLPNIKKYSDYIIEKIINLLFIKITLDSSANVTSSETMRIIGRELIEKKRIKFLSRSYKVDNNNDTNIVFGYGLFVCFDEFLYFAKSSYDGPFLGQGGCVEVTTKIDIYIPFWKKQDFQDNMNDIRNNGLKSVEFAWKGRTINVNPYPIEKVDVSKYDDHDIADLSNTINLKLDENIGSNKLIDLHSTNSYDLVRHMALEKGAELISVFDKDTTVIASDHITWLLGPLLKRDLGNKPTIVYIDCTHSYCNTTEGNCPRRESTYLNFHKNELFQLLASNKKVVFILDGVGAKSIDCIEYIDTEEIIWDVEGLEKYHKRYIKPEFFNKFKLYAERVVVRNVNEVIT